jgi:hypothetical protein
MKIKYKEDPKEWRKSTLLTVLGLALISAVLDWRKDILIKSWPVVVLTLGLATLCVLVRPRWFRGWYRLSLRLGFYSSQFIGRCILAAFFVCILTPVGFALRLMGKDPLLLKSSKASATYWHAVRDTGPLDRLF